jgi:hypothetical protein
MLSHADRRDPLYGRRLVTLTAPRSTRLWFSACGVLGCHHVRHQTPLDRTRYGVFSQGCLSCLSAMPVALRPSLVVSAWPDARVIGGLPGDLLPVQVTRRLPPSSTPTRPVVSRKDATCLTSSCTRWGVSERGSETHASTAHTRYRRRYAPPIRLDGALLACRLPMMVH